MDDWWNRKGLAWDGCLKALKKQKCFYLVRPLCNVFLKHRGQTWLDNDRWRHLRTRRCNIENGLHFVLCPLYSFILTQTKFQLIRRFSSGHPFPRFDLFWPKVDCNLHGNWKPSVMRWTEAQLQPESFDHTNTHHHTQMEEQVRAFMISCWFTGASVCCYTR